MKIIEKKCPNCGAGLSFGDTDKSCKCEYCHREFEIERDENKTDDDIYSLIDPEAVAKAAKTGLTVFAISSIVPMIIFVLVFIGFIIAGYNIYKYESNSDNTMKEEKVVKVPVSDISQLSNNDLTLFTNDSHSSFSVKGESSNKYSYNHKDDEVYKCILAYKDNHNYLFVVQKVLYINFFNQKDRKTVFIPVKYENVVSGLKISDDELDEITNGSVIDAPRFNLNKEMSSYLRGGYADYNQFVKDKINPLKTDGYKISEK